MACLGRILALAIAAAAVACGDSSSPVAEGGLPDGSAGGGSEDASAATLSPGKLDVLLVLDDGQMLEKLQAFADQAPRLIDGLMTGDVDGDGAADLPPVTDLHIGIVSTDMGAGDAGLEWCPGLGDDGVLQTSAEQQACRSDMPRFHRVVAGDDRSGVATDVACLVPLGWMGCGFEQPLEAMLKAVTASTRPVSFHGGLPGHGDGENEGFLRPDARLLLLVVIDEDDCSAADPDLYDPESTAYESSPSLRCVEHSEALHPLERYVTHLLALKPEPSAIRYALVAGVPPELADDGEGADFATVLADPRMEPGVDEEGGHPAIACEQEGLGAAFPPHRLVSLGSELAERGAAATLQSVCEPDYAPVIEPILRVALREMP